MVVVIMRKNLGKFPNSITKYLKLLLKERAKTKRIHFEDKWQDLNGKKIRKRIVMGGGGREKWETFRERGRTFRRRENIGSVVLLLL